MARAKWIGGFLGLLSGGPIGALAGFVLGMLFDTLTDDNGMEAIGYDAGGTYTGESYDSSQDYGSSGSQSYRTDEGTRNGFLFSMLTLASYVIRADGKIMHSEMEALRTFLRQNFGEAAVTQGNQIMLRLFDRQKQMEAQQPGSFRQTIIEACQQLRMVLTPRLGARDVDVESLVVEGDMSGLGGEVGDDTSAVDKGRGTQLDAACYAVPVALGLIGDAMRVLAYADVLDAVVDADGNLVLVAEAQVGRDVILMRHGEGHLVAYFFAVDEDGGLDVRALEEKGDPLTAPSLRNDNGAAVGSFADEVLLGGEEERKFHLACVAVRLHEGVEVIRGIV